MVRTYRRQSKRCTLTRHLLETAIREVVVYKKSIYSVAQDLNLPKTSLLQQNILPLLLASQYPVLSIRKKFQVNV